MASNPSQPDTTSPRRPEPQPVSTAGEFTQIFSGGAPAESNIAAQPGAAPSQSLPFAPVQDDFARLFSPEPPLPSIVPAREHRADEATLIFEAPPAFSPPAAPQQPIQTEAPPRVAQSTASEFTQVFTPIPPPASLAPQSNSPSPSEFTQVFSAIAPPATSSPAIKPAAIPSSGEFTQFFSAISERQNASTPPPETVAAGNISALAPATTVPPAGAFTQLFQPIPAPPQEANAPSSADAGSFTQIFQPVTPPAAGPNASTPRTQISPSQSAVGTRANVPERPAFGPTPPAGGSFTDVFATRPPTPAATPWTDASPQAANMPGQAGAFTELFQAPPRPSHPVDPSPFANFGVEPSSGATGWPSNVVQPSAGSAWPSAAPAAPQPLAQGGSDFTRLMQSLSTPPATGGPSAFSNESFFAPPSTGMPIAGQESEFTRVQRGSAQRDSGPAAILTAPPAAGKASGPGMAFDIGKTAPDLAAKSGKSKLLIVLLVVMNAMLLIALIVVAFLVLHKK